MSAHTPLGQSGILLNKYLTVLNVNCAVMEDYRNKWTADDLIPGRIREYCKFDKAGTRGMCWSCSDYIKKYKDDIVKYEQGPGATMVLVRELQAKQAEMDAKLDRILALLDDRDELKSLRRSGGRNNWECVSSTD
jgi:hypothetical protein